jgi:hypothetical protein
MEVNSIDDVPDNHLHHHHPHPHHQIPMQNSLMEMRGQ